MHGLRDVVTAMAGHTYTGTNVGSVCWCCTGYTQIKLRSYQCRRVDGDPCGITARKMTGVINGRNKGHEI